MTQSKQQLYISDLDGTLLNRSASLHPKHRKDLIRMIGQGLNFTVASARNPVSILHLLGEGLLQLPFVGGNGTYVTAPDGNHLLLREIAEEQAFDLFDIFEDSRMPFFISAFDGESDRMFYGSKQSVRSQWYLSDRKKSGDQRLSKLRDMKMALGNHVLGFHLIGEETEMQQLASVIAESLPAVFADVFQEMYLPDASWISCRNKLATKAAGIDFLRAHLAMEGSELIVFGDEVNDLSMFAIADKAIAVSNAHATVLEAADEVVGSNESGAVIDFLRANHDGV